MFTRIVRNFAKIRVPRDFSGELELRKNNWERITKGEPIAYIGGQPLKAEANGVIMKPLFRQGSSVSEGAEIYQFFDFGGLKFGLSLFLAPLITLYLIKLEIELRHPSASIRRIKKTLIQPKPGPRVEGPLIENPELTHWWIKRLEEPIRRGVDVVYGPKGIGKSTFMRRLCHVISNPEVLEKYSDTKTQFVSMYFDLKEQKENLWLNLYSALGAQGYSRNNKIMLGDCLKDLTEQGKKPILIFDNVQDILQGDYKSSEGAALIKELVIDFAGKRLAKVILVSSDQHISDKIRYLSIIDEECDVHDFLFSYQEGEEVIQWMNQVAKMYSRSPTTEDLQVYLKHHGSLRKFYEFCFYCKEMTLREYLKETIKKRLTTLRTQIKVSRTEEDELKEVLKPLFEHSVMEFPGEMEGLFLRLIEKNFIRRFDEDYITFNSRTSESVLRVYFGEHGDSEFLKELINEPR